MAQEIKGKVKWPSVPEDVVDAIVVATGPDPKVNRVVAYTSDNGDYLLDLSREPLGEWIVHVFHPDGVPSKPVKRDVVANVTPEVLDFRLMPLQSTSSKVGTVVFAILILLFVAAIYSYLTLHRENPPQGNPIDALLNAYVVVAADDVIRIGEDETLGSLVEQPLPRLQVLAADDRLTDDERETLTSFSERIQIAVRDDDRSALQDELRNLSLYLTDLTRTIGFFWTEDPWRILEISLVALIAVLGSKIVQIGFYLQRGTFYPEGVFTHIAHILVHPLFVVAVVLFISLGSFQLTIANESSITIDLSNPIVLVSVSFLLGLVPWPVYNFIRDSAERILGNRPA